MVFELDGILQTNLKAIAKMIGEADVKFDKQGIHIYEQSPETHFFLMFDYAVQKFNKEELFCIDMRKISNILKLLKNSDYIEVDTDSESRIKFSVTNEGKPKEMSIPKMMPKETHLPDGLDSLEFGIAFQIDKNELAEILKDVSNFGDTAWFISSNGKMTITSGDEPASYKATIDAKFSKKGNGKSKYYMEYIGKIAELDFPKLNIEMDENYVMRITGKGEKYSFVFIIAPRVMDG